MSESERGGDGEVGGAEVVGGREREKDVAVVEEGERGGEEVDKERARVRVRRNTSSDEEA